METVVNKQMTAWWIETRGFDELCAFPPIGTEVIFFIAIGGILPYKIRAGIIAEGKHAGCVKEHGTGKLFYPYLSDLIVPGSVVKSVQATLVKP